MAAAKTKPKTPDGALNKEDLPEDEEGTEEETNDTSDDGNEENGSTRVEGRRADLSNQQNQKEKQTEKDKAEDAEEQRRLAEEELDKLEPMVEIVSYTIGKGPEHGGSANEYGIYVQQPLGYVSCLRFYGLVGKTVAEAVKAGGVVDLGDAFNNTNGNIQDRARQIMEQSFNDAGSFAALIFQLVAYSPDFILEFYMLALDVPLAERKWAKAVMEQPWRPEQNKWGLTRIQGQEIIERFIDQNYDEVRDFFVDMGRGVSKRVRKNEKRRKSTSGRSK